MVAPEFLTESEKTLPIDRGIFGSQVNFDDRRIPDYNALGKLVEHCRGIGLRIVLTSGSFDMVHIGHARYLAKARSFGDLLIVGVDSDAKIRERKGPDRPIVPEEERLEMIAHLRSADIVFLKHPEEEKWKLIKTVRPDILVATQETYKPEQIAELEASYCSKVEVLEPMGETTTSARLRLIQINLRRKLDSFFDDLFGTGESSSG